MEARTPCREYRRRRQAHRWAEMSRPRLPEVVQGALGASRGAAIRVQEKGGQPRLQALPEDALQVLHDAVHEVQRGQLVLLGRLLHREQEDCHAERAMAAFGCVSCGSGPG